MAELSFAWSATEKDLVGRLSVDPSRGLDDEQARRRLERDGPNALRRRRKTPAAVKFLRQFRSPVVATLVVATALSAALGDFLDAGAIAAIILFNAIIAFAQEAKADAAVEALKTLSTPKARVLRQGEVVEIAAEAVVAGDILVLEAGDYVAADARLLLAHQLSVDQAPLTGESLPVRKRVGAVTAATPLAERSNMLFAGTAVSRGSGRAVVTAVGMGTELGRIAGMLEAAEDKATPLQARLNEVGTRLLKVSVAVVACVALLHLLQGATWLETAMSAISLAVAAIPEGLPAVVTLALGLAVHRMARRKAIVRHLPAVETLGSTDVICADKTGTLTTGKMSVRELVDAEGGVWKADGQGPAVFSALMESAVLCSNASLGRDGTGAGDPTEVALVAWAAGRGLNAAALAKAKPRLHEWSFDSDRKRMSVVVADSGMVAAHVKGAPETVLPLCRLDEGRRRRLTAAVNELTGQGRRMLAVARRVLPGGAASWKPPPEAEASWVESDLDLIGLVSLADPPRPESVEAIKRCRDAGIRVVMITGDHPVTAAAVARELKLLEPGRPEGLLTGADIDRLDDDGLAGQVESISVYARVSPEHKLRVVGAWRSRDKVVAMTGDGVNDAPALKSASIGIAMGRGGTEVARQASAMVLADDNFATIVAAVEEGRAVHGNIRRTVHYLLSGNVAEILIMFGAAVVGWPAPLAPIQLLWINLVTDGLPSLALAAEPVPRRILAHTDRPSPRRFFDKRFNQGLFFIGVTVAAMALVVYGYFLHAEGPAQAKTYAFTFLVFEELFRSFSSRSERKTFPQLGVSSNVFHLVAVLVPLALQWAMLSTHWFGAVFGVRPLEASEIVPLVALALVPVTVIEIRKLWQATAS